MISVRLPPTFMPTTPCSQPLMTLPPPSGNSIGSRPGTREVSNILPCDRRASGRYSQPVLLTRTLVPSVASLPVPTLLSVMIRESAAGPTVAEPATTGAAAAEVAAPGAAAGTVATGAAAAGAACWAWAIEAPNAASKAAINRELRVMMCAFDEVLDGAVQPSRIGRGTIIAKPYVATANMHTPLHSQPPTGHRGQRASAAAMTRGRCGAHHTA